MFDALKVIKKTVATAKGLPNATIEYNIKELPKEVEKDNFFGVPAKYNGRRMINTLNVIRKFQ